jgi:flagella basal body P-ring formation protein FlgA
MNRRRIAWLVALVAICVGALAARAQSDVQPGTPSLITLRSLARVEPGKAVTLGDVAQLRGDAVLLADAVVLAAPEVKASEFRVGLLQVRQAVEKASRGAEGRTSFSGSSCLVRVVSTQQTPAPAAASSPVPGVPTPQVENVRDHVRARIAQACNAQIADLRLTFEDGAELLDTPTAGSTVAVAPTATSDKMPLSVRVYRGDMLVAQGTVRVTVLVRREVLIATTGLSRGSDIDMGTVSQQEQWLPPSITPATRSQVLGSVARARVEPGRVIQMRDVEPPIVINRGDLVSIDCVSGTVVVTSTARAKEPGREGDIIQFQSANSKKTFGARVNGPGKAVLVAEEGGRS